VLINFNSVAPKAWEVEAIDKEYILACFTSWVDLNYNAEVLNSLPNHYLLNTMFKCLQNDDEV